MFLGQLNNEQKLAFLGLSRQVIMADQELCVREVDLLKRMRSEMDLDSEALVQTPQLEDLPSIFNDSRSQGIAILELMRVAWTDSNFEWRENRMVADVAHTLGIPDQRATAMQQWALKLKDLLDEAVDLWSE